ncbi:hypothetical protein HDU76_009356, partial [Blyttiomyces sp. JEL0837]
MVRIQSNNNNNNNNNNTVAALQRQVSNATNQAKTLKAGGGIQQPNNIASGKPHSNKDQRGNQVQEQPVQAIQQQAAKPTTPPVKVQQAWTAPTPVAPKTPVHQTSQGAM